MATLLSMTGCGEAHCAQDGISYSLEIRAFNNRYFKASIKLPETLQFLEERVEKALRSELGRGSVIYQLRVRDQRAAAAYGVNVAALQAYVDQISRARLPEGVSAAVDLGTLAALPGVCQPPEPDEDFRQQQAAIIDRLTREALAHLVAMRLREGEALRADLRGHCDGIRAQLQLVEQRVPDVVVLYQERLAARVNTLLEESRLQLEADALAREVALYADRCDVTEEITRLRSHLDQFLAACDSGDQVGRKLDFLAQEMLREANTIGSKSNDVRIVQAIVEIKSLVDRLKEQVQNVA
ncbi:MAG: YicC family protein [Phycisphaerales bacterium]|nr:MAG: YicC family protein [Phycisphaerales bacterium]